MHCSHDEIVAYVQYQVSAIEGMAKSMGLALDYVKPHGALYNDMMAKDAVRAAVMEAVANHHSKPALMLQAVPENANHKKEAEKLGLSLHFEAFADRCYDDDGKLLSRAKEGAVHTREKMMEQVKQLCDSATVTTVSGKTLPLLADTLCVHGDNEAGIQAIADIRAMIDA